MSIDEQPPDLIAHKLVTNTGTPARFHLQDNLLTVPIKPYGRGSQTADLPVQSFDAVIEQAYVEDGGLNVASFHGLHLPASEWERVGLQKHWEHEDVDLRDPFTDANRRMEFWASREDSFYDTEPEEYRFDHLDPLPDDSPLLTEWTSYDDGPDIPPVPLSYPTLRTDIVHATDADTDARGFDQIEVGTVVAIEILDHIDEWPQEPDIDKREIDIDLSPPSRYPRIQYDDINPLPHDEKILRAVHAINRHAKRFKEEADTAYQINEGAKARVYSLRKKALYKTKTVAVHRLVKGNPDQTQVTLHDLNGTHEMYCFSFSDGYSFHQPVPAVNDALWETATVEKPQEVEEIEFQSSAETQNLSISLEEALFTLAEQGINANNYLDTETVLDYDWSYEISTIFECIDTEDTSRGG